MRKGWFICVLMSLIVILGCREDDMMEVDLEIKETYTNPLSLDDEWPHGSPDPYVLKHNGIYYLYVSTDFGQTGIKGWSSTNLVDWSYEGLVSEEDETYMAWAPTVVYWNGTFYMYATTHGGETNHLLTSEYPTGPFVAKQELENIDIDSSVFIDDDGGWYMAHAGPEGIVGRTMENPVTYHSGRILDGTYLNHWTEGPQIIAHNGRHYMTFTGNHWLSAGYRVHYAVSEDGPLGNYEAPKNNPLLISTREDMHGLGNSKTVRGPDLDSYYIVYHRLIGERQGVMARQLNVDRLVFNGRKMEVLGPTNFAQPVPQMPDYYTWLEVDGTEDGWLNTTDNDNNLLIANEVSDASFTAEFNLRLNDATMNDEDEKSADSGQAGVVFSYVDEQNYGSAVIDMSQNELNVFRISDGNKEQLAHVPLPEEFDYEALHTFRVQKDATTLNVHVDDMHMVHTEVDKRSGGKIGYIYQGVHPAFDYTALSNNAGGSSATDMYHPLPGDIQAVHYLDGENRGFHIRQYAEEAEWRPEDGVPIVANDYGNYAVKLASRGDWLRYKINVEEDHTYGLDLLVEHTEEPATVAVFVNDERQGRFTIPAASSNTEETWSKQRIGTLPLSAGHHTLRIEVVNGDVTVEAMELYKAEDESFQISNAFEETGIHHGEWTSIENGYTSANAEEDSKWYFGDNRWTDYEVGIDVTLEEEERVFNGGLLLRTNHASHFEHQVNDAFRGYYVGLNSNGFMLRKVNYGTEIVKMVDVDIHAHQTYHLRVRVLNNRIDVYVDDDNEPLISYEDAHAFTYGGVGIRSNHVHMTFENLRIDHLD